MIRKKIMDEKDIENAIEDIADQIIGRNGEGSKLYIVGVRTRGVPLSGRIKNVLEKKYSLSVPMGTLDITLYRDDLSRMPSPLVRKTELPEPVDGATVVIADDVIYTGRSVRAALGEIMDYGRPGMVQLAVLIDRGMRELPIQPDFAGIRIKVHKGQLIKVMLSEVDDEDSVYIQDMPN